MSSHRHPQSGPSRERHHAYYQAEDSASRQRGRYSRYTDAGDSHLPRRRRWAAGYIDSRSCPSYDYIDRRRKASGDEDASDVEYIQPRGQRNDDAIESRRCYRASASQPSTRYGRERSLPQQPARSSESDSEEQPGSDIASSEPRNRSPRHRVHAPQRPSTSSDPDAGEGSDVLTPASRRLGSDVVSIRSGRSSTSRFSRRSGRAASEASYVKLRRREGGSSDSSSGSDDDGDYISLDEYIAGRSDCGSGRVVSGDDGGEGSDAVGSDVAARSDVGEGSDVASVEGCGGYDSEDDCIEDDCIEDDCIEDDCIEDDCIEDDRIEDDCIEEYRVDYYGSYARR